MFNNRYFNRQVVGGDFYQYAEDMQMPVLRPGFYAISPHLIGGASKGLTSFTHFLKRRDLKQLYGREYALKRENPYAKIVLEYDEEFCESFTGAKVFVLPYQYVDSFETLNGQINIYHGENYDSLAENNISGVFAHLEDLQLLDIKQYHQIKKLYYSEPKLAVFENKFLTFKEQTEEVLADNKKNNMSLRLIRR